MISLAALPSKKKASSKKSRVTAIFFCIISKQVFIQIITSIKDIYQNFDLFHCTDKDHKITYAYLLRCYSDL